MPVGSAVVIVSHKHRFVFVKTRKTAGTSIEAFLSLHAGDDAIVTPLHEDDDVAGHEPRNWKRLFNPIPEMLSGGALGARAAASDLRRRRAFWNHMPASQIRARIGKGTWDDYFTFCFERDPWEKVVSFYYWQTKNRTARGDRPDFEKWALQRPLPSDWAQYTIDGDVAVDFVGRYESLADDLRTALDRVGLDVPIDLPRVKGQYRSAEDPVELTDRVDARIAKVFAREIAAFGYPDRSAGPAESEATTETGS